MLNVSKQESLLSNRVLPLFSCPRTGTPDYQKNMIFNLNNLFSRQLKRILNGQKFGNSFIYKLPNFGENPLKTVIHFFLILRVL